MASIMKRGNTYSVRYNYKDHAGKPCKGWETFKTKAEAQERKITVVMPAAHKTSLNIRGSPLISIVFSSLTGIPNPR